MFSATNYVLPFGDLETGGTSEANHQFNFYFPAVTTNLFCYVSANTRNGTSTVNVRKNGVNGTGSVSISASATGTFEDTSNSDSFAYNDYFSMQIAPGGSSGTIDIRLFAVKVLPPTINTNIPGAGLTNFF